MLILSVCTIGLVVLVWLRYERALYRIRNNPETPEWIRDIADEALL